MKRLSCAIALMTATMAFGQSAFFEFGIKPIRHEVAYSAAVPFTSFTGAAIVRTQEDINRLWAAMQGTPAGVKTISPLRLNSNDEQFIILVLPPELTSEGLPSIASLAAPTPKYWRMEVAPSRVFHSRGLGRSAQAVVVRTPRGPDSLDVLVQTPHGSVLVRLERANPGRK